MPSDPIFAFRPAVPSDAAMVREITRAAYAKWVPVVGREPMPMRADYERAIAEHRIEILTVDGAVVGLIEMMIRPDHLWIENVVVTPARQGQGFGRRLMDRAENIAAGARLSGIRLLTNGAFDANIAMYKALGYRIDREEPFREGGTTVYMSKVI